MKQCIAAFKTTYETLNAEDCFRDAGIKFRPILKPRKIGSSCRMVLRFDESLLPLAKKVVAKSKLEFAGFYRQEGEIWIKIEND